MRKSQSIAPSPAFPDSPGARYALSGYLLTGVTIASNSPNKAWRSSPDLPRSANAARIRCRALLSHAETAWSNNCTTSSNTSVANCANKRHVIHGYRDGDRVRDQRDGTMGTVRFIELTAEQEQSGEYAVAEVQWDGLFISDELDLALPHIQPTRAEVRADHPDSTPSRSDTPR